MRKPEQSSEPSIEEILASIRKIIADDATQQPLRSPLLTEAAAEPVSRPFNPDPRRQTSHPTPALYAEPEEPAAAMAEEDILELTEDSMLEEARGQAAMGFSDETAVAEAYDPDPLREGLVTGSRSAPPSGEELESVLSNVVAEVKRLAETPKAGTEAAALSKSDWAEPLRPSGLASPRKPPVVEQWDDLAAQSDIAPAPAAASPAARQPQPSRPAPKPAWSARHLDGEAPPRARAPQAAETRQREPSPASLRAMSGPEGWADGFQMPVPENGPVTPFPEPEADDEANAAPPLTGSGEANAEIEKEKTFVGEMLTRVFGSTPKKAPESAPPPATPKLAKAEDLAKATISDFAADKLRAPAVAQALHADKPFMDAITTSLETAMADRNAAAGRNAPSPEDEFPELPADDEGDNFDAPAARPSPAPASGDLLARRLAAASQRSASLLPEPPEFPRDLPEDLLPPEVVQSPRQAATESPRARAEPLRTAAVASPPPPPSPARAPSRPEPAPLANAIAPQTASPALDALAVSPALEDSIKELIKPLIVQWLNDNLPRIVERAVREEITEQGLVSRARGEGGSRR